MEGNIDLVADLIGLLLIVALLVVGYIFGRKDERRHLENLTRDEERLREVLIFSTRYPPSEQTLDARLVSGSAVVAPDYFRMFIAGLRKVVGGRFSAYETLLDRARRQAILRMKQEARSLGCPMVFNVRVETSSLNEGMPGGGTTMEVLAYGTAIRPATGGIEDSPLDYRRGPTDWAEVGTVDLMDNPVAKWSIIVWLMAWPYGLFEMALFQTYFYLPPTPWNLLVTAGVVIALILAGGMLKQGLPKIETTIITFVYAVSLPLLLYFPAQRINALTDLSPRSESIYTLHADFWLRSDDPEMPEIRFDDYMDYWEAQETGSRYTFVLRRGLLGFWQIEREGLAQRLESFYSGESKSSASGNDRR